MLVKKLHLKPGMRFAVANAPAGFSLGKLPGVTQEQSLKRDLDLVVLFAASQKELKGQWPKALASVKPDGALWVAYPKKSSGVESDLTMGAEWEVHKDSPWQPVSSIAVDDMWSAVRFRQRPGLAQAREKRQEEMVRDADGTVCIDRKNRVITAPKDLQKLFSEEREGASGVRRAVVHAPREYVVWILAAKKPETRAARLAKTVDMLSKGKKNPSDT